MNPPEITACCVVCKADTGTPSRNKPPRRFCSPTCRGKSRQLGTCHLGHPLGANRKARCSECARNRNRRKRRGHRNACRFCGSTATRIRSKQCETCGPRAYTRLRMLRRYRIDAAALDELVLRAEGRCEACGERCDRLALDHSHVTGNVRGLLCDGCNTAAGIIEGERGLLVAKFLETYGDGLKFTVSAPPRSRAAAVILETLGSGPVPRAEVLRTVQRKCGIGPTTTHRVAKRIGVEARACGSGPTAPMMWRLPEVTAGH